MPNRNLVPFARPRNGRATVYLVHPDQDRRDHLRALIDRLDCAFREFDSAEAFLDAYEPGGEGCLVVELGNSGRSAHELLKRIQEAGARLPAVIISERGDVATAVRAMRAGASALIERPFAASVLLREIRRLLGYPSPLRTDTTT